MDIGKSFYWKKKKFGVDILKVFVKFVTTLFLFCFFGHDACGIPAPWPGIEPIPPALEGEDLTPGPSGKS